MRAALHVVLLLALLASARASEEIVYVDAAGAFAAGLEVVGVEGVDLARVAFAPQPAHHRLAVRLDYAPAQRGATLGEASVSTRAVMLVELHDNATGALLPGGALRFDVPGTLTYDLAGDADVRADVYLLQGVLVEWRLVIAGQSDPTP